MLGRTSVDIGQTLGNVARVAAVLEMVRMATGGDAVRRPTVVSVVSSRYEGHCWGKRGKWGYGIEGPRVRKPHRPVVGVCGHFGPVGDRSAWFCAKNSAERATGFVLPRVWSVSEMGV